MRENNIFIYKFDKQKFKFRELFNKFALSNIGFNLEEIHKTDIGKLVPLEILSTGEDAMQPFCELFYNIDDEFDGFNKDLSSTIINENKFMDLYRWLINDLKKNLFDNNHIVYQKKPTLRVHLPNNVSTGSYHRDSEYGHSKNEINFWLPLVDSKGTATIHIEDNFMSENYKPINVKYGEMIVFDSSLKHGTEINVENYTRVIFDFRIMKYSEYEETNNDSLVRKKKFKLGSYYEQL